MGRKKLLTIFGLVAFIFVLVCAVSHNPSTQSPAPKVGDVWVLIVNSAGFPPNDKYIEGFWAYDLLTKYYKYPKSQVRFLATMNDNARKWLSLGGIQLLDSFSMEKTQAVQSDIYSEPNKQSYTEALKWLKVHATGDDKVIILSFTHGDSGEKGIDYDGDAEFDSDDEYLELGGKERGETQKFYDGEFAELVTEINAKEMLIWITACHGGGFYWDVADRIRQGGNVDKLYLMGPAIDERGVYQVIVSAEGSATDFNWPDLHEGNFFGFLLTGLIGLREDWENGKRVLRIDPPTNRTIYRALEEVYDCVIDAHGTAGTIGLLDFTEGSKFPMKLAFGCQFNEESKTSQYPGGEATLGYMSEEKMDFSFWWRR